MEKLKFNTVGQFLVALEEGPLYDENGAKYVINKNSPIQGLTVDRCDERRCHYMFNTLLSIHKIGLTHTFTRQEPIPDKALVWCWGGDMIGKEVHFYDQKTDNVFGPFGNRYHGGFDNYEVIEPNKQGLYEHPFDWANEAKKKLED